MAKKEKKKTLENEPCREEHLLMDAPEPWWRACSWADGWGESSEEHGGGVMGVMASVQGDEGAIGDEMRWAGRERYLGPSSRKAMERHCWERERIVNGQTEEGGTAPSLAYLRTDGRGEGVRSNRRLQLPVDYPGKLKRENPILMVTLFCYYSFK